MFTAINHYFVIYAIQRKVQDKGGGKNEVDYDLLGYRSGLSATSTILYSIIPKTAKYIFTLLLNKPT